VLGCLTGICVLFLPIYFWCCLSLFLVYFRQSLYLNESCSEATMNYQSMNVSHQGRIQRRDAHKRCPQAMHMPFCNRNCNCRWITRCSREGYLKSLVDHHGRKFNTERSVCGTLTRRVDYGQESRIFSRQSVELTINKGLLLATLHWICCRISH